MGDLIMRKNVKLFTAVVLAAFFSASGSDSQAEEQVIVGITTLVMEPYQDHVEGDFLSRPGVVLDFGSPAGEDEVLVVEFVSVILTTDKSPPTVQAVVDLKVKTGAVSDVVHRLVLTQQDDMTSEVWLANQRILAYVYTSQTLEVHCVTNPPPFGREYGCSASVAGRIIGF